VTCGKFSEEFSLDCTLADVQAYFNVNSGGLLLNGRGPVVRRVYDGCAYELRGATMSPPKTLEHVSRATLPGGRGVVAKVAWKAESSKDKAGKKAESACAVERLEELYSRGITELDELNRRIAAKPFEWAMVGAATLCLFMFFGTLIWYLSGYDPTQELALREHGDKMTVESLTVVMLSFAFGCLAFFSS